jgi:hypothetical protein
LSSGFADAAPNEANQRGTPEDSTNTSPSGL